jgi:hypothetical protein
MTHRTRNFKRRPSFTLPKISRMSTGSDITDYLNTYENLVKIILFDPKAISMHLSHYHLLCHEKNITNKV